MKRLFSIISLMFIVLFLSSCDKGVLPTDDIGLSAAFGHCIHSLSYWIFGIVATLIVGFVGWRMKKVYNETGTFSPFLAFALAAILLVAWCYRPSELAWNTTVEQAARGVWIGY